MPDKYLTILLVDVSNKEKCKLVLNSCLLGLDIGEKNGVNVGFSLNRLHRTIFKS